MAGKSRFENLFHFDDVPYSYDEYHSRSAQTAFLSNRLRNAHEQIRSAIHTPLYHLRMYNTLFHFGAVITKNGENLTASLLQDLNKLAQDFPQLPLYHSEQAFDEKAFTEAYAATASPYLHNTTLNASIKGWLNKFSARHGLPHIHPHRFRHSLASLLINNGTNILAVSRRLGHANSVTTLSVYAHVLQKADAQSAECIADVLLRKPPETNEP